MSNLVDHARRELELVGEDPETIEGLVKVIKAFADMGHSGGSASVAIPMLERLLRFQPLAPLTYGPEEWVFHSGDDYGIAGKDIWQNIRDSRIMSYDGGKTHYNVEDKGSEDSKSKGF